MTLRWRNHSSFTQISSSSHCCHPKELAKQGKNHSRLWMTKNGFSYRARACAPLCRKTPRCTFFSHSETWGNCYLCSGCELSLPRDYFGRRYTSWRRVGQASSPSSTVEVEAEQAPVNETYLDDVLYKQIFRGHDVYANLSLRPLDLVGWGLTLPLYERLVERLRPRLVAEVGVWKGGTTIALAEALAKFKLRAGKVIAVDTWLGAPEMWERQEIDSSRAHSQRFQQDPL